MRSLCIQSAATIQLAHAAISRYTSAVSKIPYPESPSCLQLFCGPLTDLGCPLLA